MEAALEELVTAVNDGVPITRALRPIAENTM